MPPRKSSDADLIKHFQRIVKYSAEDEDKFVKIPTVFAVTIASLLDRVRKPRGRPRISKWDRMQESMVLMSACRRKAELIATGMSRGEATEQAAKEAAAELSKTRGLSVPTIKRRMQRHR